MLHVYVHYLFIVTFMAADQSLDIRESGVDPFMLQVACVE